MAALDDILFWAIKQRLVSAKEHLPKELETRSAPSAKQLVALARQQMAEQGITEEQRKAYKLGLTELLYRGIEPYNYGTTEKVKQFLPNLLKGRSEELFSRGREDTWRLYLGLPQLHGTYEISDFRPSRSKENKTYFKLTDFWPHLRRTISQWTGTPSISQLEQRPSSGTFLDHLGIMGEHKMERSKDQLGDYLSYYDLWNLEGSPEGERGVLGKPIEIYDRLYFDSKNNKIYWEGPPEKNN